MNIYDFPFSTSSIACFLMTSLQKKFHLTQDKPPEKLENLVSI